MRREIAEKVQPRIQAARTRLGDVVPLRTPYVVFIDPSSACNFQCTFCPTGDRELIRSTGRYQGRLALADFEKAVGDIAEFEDKLKVLRLYKDGEPLLNKNLPAMIRMAKDANIAECIDTTSNGYLLSGEVGEKLVAAGLDRINLSIDGMSEEQFLTFAKTKVDFPSFVANIRDFYTAVAGQCEVVVKTTSEIIGEDLHAKFYDTFGDYCDRIFVENASPCWPDFDVEERMDISITTGLYGNQIEDVQTCPYLFYSISVNSDLSVSACFVDWSRGLNVGTLKERSLKDIWTGPEMQAHRLAHLQGLRSKHAICGNCSQVTHCKADNVDADREKMLKAMSALPEDSFSAAVAGEYADVG
ncbi:radical SAM/SPASM domain-containing protein [Novosphingobium naphthalenivorans]|uniref:radical SAM/SPASM domain-containing protein n=1 Tax=Novosphingobium naphthalenivorans TaxID=273168 RepID=UPI0009FBBF68|nr:radical SAM/SPASM domain-containing protein [Novosphingobium naphthalenivorans]